MRPWGIAEDKSDTQSLPSAEQKKQRFGQLILMNVVSALMEEVQAAGAHTVRQLLQQVGVTGNPAKAPQTAQPALSGPWVQSALCSCPLPRGSVSCPSTTPLACLDQG